MHRIAYRTKTGVTTWKCDCCCRKFLTELVRLAEASGEEVSESLMQHLAHLLVEPTVVKFIVDADQKRLSKF